jgi:HD superfamily phosphodiesterase
MINLATRNSKQRLRRNQRFTEMITFIGTSFLFTGSENSYSLLAPLGKRWSHVQGVVERARWVGSIFDETDRSYLIAAAYFHDIGYAPSLQRTGFHPLDGAYYLQSFRQDRLVSLVALSLWGTI